MVSLTPFIQQVDKKVLYTDATDPGFDDSHDKYGGGTNSMVYTSAVFINAIVGGSLVGQYNKSGQFTVKTMYQCECNKEITNQSKSSSILW